jgi:hypothetical protein
MDRADVDVIEDEYQHRKVSFHMRIRAAIRPWLVRRPSDPELV